MACLICTPSALGLRVYISGRPLVPVLQLLNKLLVILPGLGHDMNSVVSVVIVLITTVST